MPVLDRFRRDGKCRFITGGSRGLGHEMALAIAEAGGDVILVGREAESLASTATAIRDSGRGDPIGRRHDQAPNNGGNYFTFDLTTR